MDSKERIIDNLRYVVGCNGLRDYGDLGRMRLRTMAKRVRSVQSELSATSIVSIFIAWLQANVMRVGVAAAPVKAWCKYLAHEYGGSLVEVLWYWGSSEGVVWCHLSASSGLPGVKLRMGDLCRKVRRAFPRAGERSAGWRWARWRANGYSGGLPRAGESSVGSGGDRWWQANVYWGGSSSWRPEDEPRGRRAHCASGGEKVDGDCRDGELERMKSQDWISRRGDCLSISPGYFTDRTDCDAISARLAGHVTSQFLANGAVPWDHAPPARYACGICGAWGTHYVWNCTELRGVGQQAIAGSEVLPTDDEMKRKRRTEEKPLMPTNPGHDVHSAGISRSALQERQKRVREEDNHDDAWPQIAGARAAASEPRVSWPPNDDSALRQRNEDLVECSLSLKAEHVEIPIREKHAQETARCHRSSSIEDRHGKIQKMAYATPKELSTADEATLHRAYDFLCRLGGALQRKYAGATERDLMAWHGGAPRKRARTGSVNGHDCVLGNELLFDTGSVSVPCSVSTMGTDSPESEESYTVGKLSDIFFNQMQGVEDVSPWLSGETMTGQNGGRRH